MVLESLDRPYRGGFVGAEHRFALTVYFEDTDAYGIVYYANYLKFMERARSDMIRAVGVDQSAELRESGSAYAVVEVDIRYRRPGKLGDDLLVVSTVDQVLASSVHIHQRVMRGPELLTDAHVTAAFLDGDGRPRRQPKDWVEKFRGITTQAR
jgi:acyl-CoA thioester hydrolase